MTDEAADPIMMEALEWFVRMRDDEVTIADKQAFQAWLAADEAHGAAWERAEALWKRLDIVQPEFDRIRRSQAFLSRRNFMFGTVAILAGAGGLYAYNRPDLFAQYATDIGERRTIALPDGSTVELGSYSALSTRFTERERHVYLFRGEGFFDVASDPKRAFLVGAGNGATQALGTKFNVKYVDDLVTVAVNEHAADVRASGFSNVRLREGWQVSYGRDGLGTPVQANFDTIEAWRQDRIVFQDVPLRRVLTELERYRRGKIVLMDSGIGNIPVTAIFNTKQADSALQTIADTLPIRVINATGFMAIVYPGA
jgi:transmembrane sensor